MLKHFLKVAASFLVIAALALCSSNAFAQNRSVSGKVVDGTGFGFRIGTKARSGMIKGGSAIVDSSYVFADTDKLGQFRFGYSKSAGSMFSVSYANALTGYNLVDSGNASAFFVSCILV